MRRGLVHVRLSRSGRGGPATAGPGRREDPPAAGCRPERSVRPGDRSAAQRDAGNTRRRAPSRFVDAGTRGRNRHRLLRRSQLRRHRRPAAGSPS
jgi:hypothetical protein